MSLNTMPFFGKSGTSRTAERSCSTVFEAIAANASGPEPKVNQFANFRPQPHWAYGRKSKDALTTEQAGLLYFIEVDGRVVSHSKRKPHANNNQLHCVVSVGLERDLITQGSTCNE